MRAFNRMWVLGNLRETIEHIETTINAIESGKDTALEDWIEFIYRDLNRAWNGRRLTLKQCQDRDKQIRSFLTDIDFGD